MEVDIKVKRLAIYVHIPFCKQKCKYCDFNSFYINGEEKIGKYIDAVCKEITHYSDKSKEFLVTSVYFGGGTPSFIDEKYIEKVMECINRNYTILKDAEITIEVNPGTVNVKKLKTYKEIGFNRLSIGVQSLNDKILKAIGRVHSATEAKECFYSARASGFNNISLDIMFGLPGQTLKDIKNTIREFMVLDPEHISAYSLKIEEGTIFGKLYNEKKLELPPEDLEREMYYFIKKELKSKGIFQYEISNFSKPGYESRHNTAYWDRQDYLGFGISASSCFNEVRTTNTEDFNEYIVNPIENFLEKEVLDVDTIEMEKVVLGLRMMKGVDYNLIGRDEWKKAVNEMVDLRLLQNLDGHISLTDKGMDLANQVFVRFV